MLSLGALVSAAFLLPALMMSGADYSPSLSSLTMVLTIGTTVEGLGLMKHASDMRDAEHEGAVSHYIQTTTFGRTYVLRNLSLAICCASAISLASFGANGSWSLTVLAISGLAVVCASLIGRALFYALVVPTTMSGAFFWKNKGFEQHARDIGLARMPQLGVLLDGH